MPPIVNVNRAMCSKSKAETLPSPENKVNEGLYLKFIYPRKEEGGPYLCKKDRLSYFMLWPLNSL